MSDFHNSESGGPASAPRTRSLAETPALAALAAKLLETPSMLPGLGAAELQCVVSYLRLASFAASTTLFRQGDASNTGYLLLILSGDVRVEASLFGGDETVDVSVLGPGDVIGEMGLIDGAPRASTCIAATPVHAAALSRKAVEIMLAEHPAVAAKLMIVLAKRLCDRLRAMDEQLGIYVNLARDARLELERLSVKAGR